MDSLNFPSPILFWVLCPIVQEFWSPLIQILGDFIWLGESDFVSRASSSGQCQNRVLRLLLFLISDFQLKTVILSVTPLWLKHIVTANEREWR